MKERLFRNLKNLLLFLGACAATSNWLWAKGFITLWILMGLFSCFPPHRMIVALQNIFSFMALAASICGMGLIFSPPLHPAWFVLIWLAIISYTVLLWRQPLPADSVSLSRMEFQWPTQRQATGFVVFICGGILLTYLLLCAMLQQPYTVGWGNALTWATVGFLFAYPKSIHLPLSKIEKRGWIALTPIFIAFVLIFHILRHNAIESQLAASAQQGNSPNDISDIADMALRQGYIDLGISAILSQTERLFDEQGWIDAVHYHRSMWKSVDKERLASAFQKHPQLGDNFYLFIACYGGQLALEPTEYAIDFDVVPDQRLFWVLTSHGRLLRISAEGITCDHQTRDNPVALSVGEQSGSPAILSASGFIDIIRVGKLQPSIELPANRVWKDLLLSPDETRLWTLDGNGRIEEYSLHGNQPPKESYPPLWGEADIAKAFYPAAADPAFFVLDRANGVHYRGNPPLPLESPLHKQLLDCYNHERQIAANLGYWEPYSSLMMLEQTGRILFLPIPDFSNDSTSIDEIASTTTPAPTLVDSLFQYDPNQSVWYRQLETLAVVALPEINTLIELQRNGTLQIIAMPQRFHIRFIHPNHFRLLIPTSDSSAEKTS